MTFLYITYHKQHNRIDQKRPLSLNHSATFTTSIIISLVKYCFISYIVWNNSVWTKYSGIKAQSWLAWLRILIEIIWFLRNILVEIVQSLGPGSQKILNSADIRYGNSLLSFLSKIFTISDFSSEFVQTFQIYRGSKQCFSSCQIETVELQLKINRTRHIILSASHKNLKRLIFLSNKILDFLFFVVFFVPQLNSWQFWKIFWCL